MIEHSLSREKSDFRRSGLYVALMKNLQLAGCPVCRIGHEQEHRFIDSMFYERVNDPELRQNLKKSMGFCYEHALQVISFGDPLGNAIIYKDLLVDVKNRMKEAVAQAKGGSFATRPFFHRSQESDPDTRHPLHATAECPICVSRRQTDHDYLDFLVTHIDDDALATAYRESFGLCTPHLAAAVRVVHRRCADRRLVQLEQLESVIMDRLVAELKEIMRKSDYRFADEPSGPERDAWMRAIHKISGSPKM